MSDGGAGERLGATKDLWTPMGHSSSPLQIFILSIKNTLYIYCKSGVRSNRGLRYGPMTLRHL